MYNYIEELYYYAKVDTQLSKVTQHLISHYASEFSICPCMRIKGGFVYCSVIKIVAVS